MMSRFLPLALITLLAACGADGAPTKADGTAPAVSLTGSAKVGVIGGN
jgi:hypothetical protein